MAFDQTKTTKILDSNIGGYNPTPMKREPSVLSKIAKYCDEQGISYGEYQRREFFGLLPPEVVEAHKVKRNIYIMPEQSKLLSKEPIR